MSPNRRDKSRLRLTVRALYFFLIIYSINKLINILKSQMFLSDIMRNYIKQGTYLKKFYNKISNSILEKLFFFKLIKTKIKVKTSDFCVLRIYSFFGTKNKRSFFILLLN